MRDIQARERAVAHTLKLLCPQASDKNATANRYDDAT